MTFNRSIIETVTTFIATVVTFVSVVVFLVGLVAISVDITTSKPVTKTAFKTQTAERYAPNMFYH